MKSPRHFVQRVITCALLVLTFAGRAAEIVDASAIQASIRKAAAFLLSQQSGDGAWHSTRYGLLRSGQALTPFVLNALLQIPESISTVPAQKITNAIAFIKAHQSDDGALGMAEKLLHDYPNYATALGLQALSRAGAEPGAAAKMAAFLRSQQFAGTGWTAQHPAFGAWGMGGFARTPQEPGHVDLSMTRHVLEALRAHDPNAHAKAFEDALIFLHRCQNFAGESAGAKGNGGFYFSTVVIEANKAGPDGARFKSYGTATADGILALLACGVPTDDPRVQAAANWLLEHHRPGVASGFSEAAAAKRWDTGLQFYYDAAAAKVFKALNIKQNSKGAGIRAELAAVLVKSQSADGSWANENFLVKEDDRLIATVFALGALLDLR